MKKDGWQELKRFFLDYWRGVKPLWKAYWLIGMGGGILFTVLLLFAREQKALFIIYFITFLIYAFWSSVAIRRCADNASRPAWKYLARVAVVWGGLGFLINMSSNYFDYIELQNSTGGVEAAANAIAQKYENKRASRELCGMTFTQNTLN